ncbi:hypothetical protein ACQKWADRAFT_283820 [Trichoderma austrokoningii]
MSTGTLQPVYPPEASERRPTATVLWDYQNCMSLFRIPSWDGPLTLMTPVVVPPAGNDPADNRDPFEIFGKSLTSREIPIRHVPYTKNQGITGAHVTLIRKAKVVIFVITHLDGPGFPLQLGFAELVAQICQSRPLVILACCPFPNTTYFRTVVRVAGYANPELLTAATLFLDGGGGAGTFPAPYASMSVLNQNQLLSDNTESAWPVRPWVAERDLLETCALWQQCLPYPFHVIPATLESLLKRDGYALHYVVRDPATGSLVGFCAAYATFADSSDVALVGSIAAVIVQVAYRGRGIGSALHDAAMSRLQRVRGVQRLHLGSTFPRLLCGVPAEMHYVDQWFERRGWPVSVRDGHDGQSGLVADWILRFIDLPSMTVYSVGLGFRQCVDADAAQVLGVESRPPATSTHSHGWYDMYAQTWRQGYTDDIIVACENDTIVATAIIYTPGGQSPAAIDIPWPAALSNSIGGATCICIKEDANNSREIIFTELIFACSRTLSQRGMTGMFLDGVSVGQREIVPLGFQKWMQYKDVWREMPTETRE